jgi:hypothetical protein
MSHSRFGGDIVKIRSMFIQQTGAFHDVYNRAFQMELNEHSMESIRNRLMSAGKGRITANSFRGISAGILAPVSSVTDRDLIEIPEGWGESRCRFMMEVVVESRLGGEDVYYFQGFSSYLGLTRNGNIDENMPWYINGFIRVQRVERMTPRGPEYFGIVKESAQVIDGRLVYDSNNRVELMRTVDVYSNMQQRFISNGYASEVSDYRTRLNSPADAIFARRADNLPGQYLSSTLETYRRNIQPMDFGVDSDNILARTQQELASDIAMLEDNPFLRQLAVIKQVQVATNFTLRDLYDLDPDCRRNGVIEGTILEGRALAKLASTDAYVSDWRAATIEAQWATQIANSLGAIMMSNYHRGYTGSISNLNIDHEIVVMTEDALPIAENMPLEIFERMEQQIHDLLFDLSGAGRDDFAIRVSANLYDQTEIFVSVHGGHEQRFFVPSFADSLMTPFFTRDATHLENLSNDIETLIHRLPNELDSSTGYAVSGI